MKDTLKPGATHRFQFVVTRAKTVPCLLPESADIRAMPEVLATGFMVGLMEWACLDHLKPHLDEGEGSLGTEIAVSHEAATPPGLTVTIDVTLQAIEGRTLTWQVMARDDQDVIGQGTHQRTLVRWERFNERVAQKRRAAGLA